MGTYFDRFDVSTQGHCDVLDITADVSSIVGASEIKTGIALVAIAGSTAGITTIEYEAGAVQDLKEACERLAPSVGRYHHDARWGDGNGYAHVRSALVGTSQTFPVEHGRLALGTWQQIVLIDFDNRTRTRTVSVHVVGD